MKLILKIFIEKLIKILIPILTKLLLDWYKNHMDKKKIERILKTDSRYVIISKNYPNFILEEQKIYNAY